MSRFLTNAHLESTGDRDESGRSVYRLTRDLKYQHGDGRHSVILTMPAGRLTNLATIPHTRVLQWLYRELVRPSGKYIRAPILHDFLCNEDFPGNPDEVSGFTRFEADAMLRSALRSLGAPRWKVLSVYCAVRAYAVWMGIR